VRDLSVCRAIDVQKLPHLSAIAQRQRVGTGRLLFAEGDVAEDVHTLTSGMLKLYKLMQDGRRQVVGFMVPGDFLGLAFGRTYAYSAEAATPAAACHFPRARFFKLLEEFPSLEKEILSRTSTELAAAQDQMLLLGRKTARERLASFLLRLAERRGEHDGPIELPMSRGDIADYLGLTIETVSRTFTSLRQAGLIELPAAHQLVICRPAELDRAAGH
jgi:CRP/FNR family transcriptional regulator, anaerobic regulatory protein